MKQKFCLINKENYTSGAVVGLDYALKHKSEWVDVPKELEIYLTAGYVKGVDHIVMKKKAYMLMKTYIMPEDGIILIIAVESTSGCDTIYDDSVAK